MLYTGRQKQLPSHNKTTRITTNLNAADFKKLDRLCELLNCTYAEYFRSLLKNDER